MLISMGLDMALVFVEVDRKLASYVIKNLDYHVEAFPETPIYLVSDDKPDKLSGNVTWIDTRSSIFRSAELLAFDTSLKNWTFGNQHSYWSATTKRLLILHALQKELDRTNLIHLESDSLLLDAITLKDIDQTVNGISYPLQNPKLGCASIFAVQNGEALNSLIKYILQRWHKTDLTDMQILGEFSIEYPNLVSILPSQSFDEILFDPVLFGRYLLGSDARHFRFPRSNFGFAEQEHWEFLSQIADITAVAKVNESGRRTLSVLIEFFSGEQSLLGNLHVHSKRIENAEQLASEINDNWSRIKRSNLKLGPGAKLHKGRFDSLVLLERFLTKINTLRGSSSEIRLR